MVLIENFPACTSFEELRQRERFYYDEYRPTLKNVLRPYVSDIEFDGLKKYHEVMPKYY